MTWNKRLLAPALFMGRHLDWNLVGIKSASMTIAYIVDASFIERIFEILAQIVVFTIVTAAVARRHV